MPELTLAYLAGTFVGLFIGAVAYAFLSTTSPDDDDGGEIDADDDDTTAGVGPFALCAGCGRIAPRDEQIRLCPRCAPPPDAVEDIVSDR